MLRASTSLAETNPRGICLSVVLGFQASNLASINLFIALAALRAPTRATMIQKNTRAEGSPLAASSIPIKPKGKAKRLWLNITRSPYSFNFARMLFVFDAITANFFASSLKNIKKIHYKKIRYQTLFFLHPKIPCLFTLRNCPFYLIKM